MFLMNFTAALWRCTGSELSNYHRINQRGDDVQNNSQEPPSISETRDTTKTSFVVLVK